MKALKFTLKGETAFFKKPDVNTYMYFTYGNIHKIALLGILGAILGLKGYNQQEGADYPEFYQQLMNLKVAIVPKKDEKGLLSIFGKKVQTFNNSVGYASQEAGGNLIVREQWLEKPQWTIYIREDHPYYQNIVEKIIGHQCTYLPYLGTNDHLATIINEEEIELQEIRDNCKISSLFIKEDFIEAQEEEGDFFEVKETYYKYQEKLPISLEKEYNQYQFATFIATNQKMQNVGGKELFVFDNQVLYFF